MSTIDAYSSSTLSVSTGLTQFLSAAYSGGRPIGIYIPEIQPAQGYQLNMELSDQTIQYNPFGYDEPEPPCVPDVTAPPPFNKFTEWEDYNQWWGDCIPEGVVGPGASNRINDPTLLWEALSFCYLETAADSMTHSGFPDSPDYNYVFYAWIGDEPGYPVLDALCGLASDSGFGGAGTFSSPPADNPATWWNESLDRNNDGVIEVMETELWNHHGSSSPPAEEEDYANWTEEQWSDYYNNELSPEEQELFDNALSQAVEFMDDDTINNVLYGDALGEGCMLAPGGPDTACLAALYLLSCTDCDVMVPDENEADDFMDPLGEEDPCGPPFYARC